MKRNRLATFVFALAAAGAVHAQSDPVTARIPFDFVVGGRTLPAGNYVIHEDLTRWTVTFQQEKGNGVAVALAMQNEALNRSEAPELVFHQYGDRYFISKVDFPGYRITLPATKLEHELAASSHKPGKTVVAALR